MSLEIRNISGHKGIRYKPLKDICKKILTNMKIPDAEVSLLFVDDKYIKNINKKYLHRNRPTDVIAFSMLEDKMYRKVAVRFIAHNRRINAIATPFKTQFPIQILGDIVISVDTAKLQAQEYNHPLNYELKILFIHGLLHLFGYDDTTEKSKNKMLKMEMKYKGEVT